MFTRKVKEIEKSEVYYCNPCKLKYMEMVYKLYREKMSNNQTIDGDIECYDMYERQIKELKEIMKL